MRIAVFWILVVLAIPIYWTADKLLQKVAVRMASERVLAEASDQAFWARMFNLSTPLRKQSLFFEEDTSLDSNAIKRTISGALGGTPFDHEVVFILRAKSGKLTWLKYHLELCGDDYCPYDKGKFVPSQEYPKEDIQSEMLSRNLNLSVLGYRLIATYEIGVAGNGKVRWSNIRILDSARNPVDRFLRELSSGRPPYFWQTGWQTSEDVLMSSIPER